MKGQSWKEIFIGWSKNKNFKLRAKLTMTNKMGWINKQIKPMTNQLSVVKQNEEKGHNKFTIAR